MEDVIELLLDNYESHVNQNDVDSLSDAEFEKLLADLNISDTELAEHIDKSRISFMRSSSNE